MNAMAALSGLGTNAEAARRLYRSTFARNLRALTHASSYLPPDLLVPTEAGGFSRADRVALGAAGIDPAALLAHDYAGKLEQPDDQKQTPFQPASLPRRTGSRVSSAPSLQSANTMCMMGFC